MPIEVFEAGRRAISMALLEEALSIAPNAFGQRLMIEASPATIARIATFVAAAPPPARIDPKDPESPFVPRVYGNVYLANDRVQEDYVNFYAFGPLNQNGTPQADPIVRLANFGEGAKAKKAAEAKAAAKAKVKIPNLAPPVDPKAAKSKPSAKAKSSVKSQVKSAVKAVKKVAAKK